MAETAWSGGARPQRIADRAPPTPGPALGDPSRPEQILSVLSFALVRLCLGASGRAEPPTLSA